MKTGQRLYRVVIEPYGDRILQLGILNYRGRQRLVGAYPYTREWRQSKRDAIDYAVEQYRRRLSGLLRGQEFV